MLKSATASTPVGRWGEREDGILAVASSLFAADGHEEISMAKVASAAGLSEGTLYNYFRDKRDLVLRVSIRNFEQLIAEAERVAAEAPSLKEGLQGLIAVQLRTIVASPKLYGLWLREVRGTDAYRSSPARKVLRRYTSAFGQLLQRWSIGRGRRPGLGVPVMRDLVFGGAEHVAWTAIVQQREKDLDIEREAARLAAAFLRAFRLAGLPAARRGKKTRLATPPARASKSGGRQPAKERQAEGPSRH